MTDIAVVTANFAVYDEPRGAAEQTLDAEWMYYSDVMSALVPMPWTSIYAGTRGYSPRLAAKIYKLAPWTFLTHDYRWIVWIDANVEITSPTFLEEATIACGNALVAAFKHPYRTRVCEEVEASPIEVPTKYEVIRADLRRQISDYSQAGFRDDVGLWACGVLVWNMLHPDVIAFGEQWLHECEAHTIQDQVSFPYVAWDLGVTPAMFPVSQRPDPANEDGVLSNPWLRIHPHQRED